MEKFIANAVCDWWRFNGTGTVFIDSGSPWQNAWIKSFNGRLRDELLTQALHTAICGPPDVAISTSRADRLAVAER